MRTGRMRTCLGTALLAVAAVGLAAGPALGVIVVKETFGHPDGALVGRTPTPGPGGAWAAHSGAGSKAVQVVSGAISIVQSTGSGEDVNTSFAALGAGGKLYAGFDLVNTGGNSDVYFAHFMVGTTFRSRVFITSGGGDYTLGFSDTSTLGTVKWATGLMFGTTYRVVTSYDFDTGTSELWLDPEDSSSTMLSLTGTPGTAVVGYAFRQAAPTTGSIQTIDNLCVATTFEEARTGLAAGGSLQIQTVGASPVTVHKGNKVLLTAAISGGNMPYTVTADLSTIGGLASQAMNDAGTDGDASAGDGVYSYLATVTCGTTAETKSIPVSVTDSTTPTPATASGSISLTVDDGGATTITVQPTDASICTGGTAIFFATATGGGLSYQWYDSVGALTDGGDISGATTSLLRVANATAGATYYLVVSGCSGQATSNTVTVSITSGATADQKQVVISQVFGGGGNTNAVWQNDFVELFNKGTQAVSLEGWTVQYASAVGGDFSNTPRFTKLSGTIQPGQYLLIKEGAGNSCSGAPCGVALPTPDIDGTAGGISQPATGIAIGSAGGKVALVSSTGVLVGTCPLSNGASPDDCRIVDFLGWGTGVDCAEGGNGATWTSNTTSITRISLCTDTDNNGNDFTYATTVTPHNSSTTVVPAVVSPTAAVGRDICPDTSTSLSVVAIGGCLSYQWQVNAAPAFSGFVPVTTGSGGTTPAYTTPVLGPADTGTQYKCVVSDSLGTPSSVDSPVFTVNVIIPATSADKQVVISQIYGSGGNIGATYQNDFIELFNRGTTAVNLSGWSVQYASDKGTTWQTTSLSAIVLAPGQYYLIKEAAGTSCAGNLPCGVVLPVAADVTGTINMSATAGKVALAKGTASLSGACPLSDCRVVDFVGVGNSADCNEGTSKAPGASDTTKSTTRSPVCSDTNDNGVDFAVADVTPHNVATFGKPGDFDGSTHVDTADFNLFKNCVTGPAVPYSAAPPALCTLPTLCNSSVADLDRDGDVDQDDFAAFQRCFTGPTAPADANCLGLPVP